MKLKTFFALLLLVVIGCGCHKSNDDSITEIAILKELPKMYLEGKLQEGEHQVIQTQEELLQLYSQDEINKVSELATIDFSTQTLLIGKDNYPNEANLSYKFLQKGANEYIFLIDVIGIFTRPDVFSYGIVVSKLPKNAQVAFQINKK